MKCAVTDAIRSPLNEKQWNVRCVAGHWSWVTQKTRPKRVACKACAKADIEAQP